MRLIVTREEFVNDDSLINQIDLKIPTPQFSRAIFQLVRRTNGRAHNTMGGEMIPEQDKFVRCREIFPIQNCNIWCAAPAPFAVSREQSLEQFLDRRELLKAVPLREDRHCRQFEEQSV